MSIVAFFGSEKTQENWWLSNFAYSPFTAVVKAYDNDKITFVNMEMWIMFQKAVLFNDLKSAESIVYIAHSANENNIKQVAQQFKSIGRKVQNFNQNVWDQNKINIVVSGLSKKFKQNPELLAKLMGTGNAMLAEASPYDAIWGTGLNQKTTVDYYNKGQKWPGQNLLGKCLMNVRKQYVK